MRKKEMIGILLAGGLSRRYGSPKAFAEINDQKFYEISYDILTALCDDVIIVTRPELVKQFPKKAHVIVDEERFFGCGPMAGIYSAMAVEEASSYLVLPCDMPLLTKESVEKLVNIHKKEVTVPIVDGRMQPLVSVWERTSISRLEETLVNKQYKMTEVFKKLSVEYVDAKTLTDSNETFMNVNTLDEDKEARKWNEKPS